MRYSVTMVALGGPLSEFTQRLYEVVADTPGAAIDKAMPAFMEDISKSSIAPEHPYRFDHASVNVQHLPVRRIL